MVRRDLFSSMHDGSLLDEGVMLLRIPVARRFQKKKSSISHHDADIHPLSSISVEISVIFGFNLPDVRNRNTPWLVHDV